MRFRTLLFFTLALSLACGAQAPDTNSDQSAINLRIERRVRVMFELPPSLDVTVGKRVPSEIPGYDKVPVTLSKAGRSTTHDFLISADNKNIIEWEKLDIGTDINTSGRPERGNKDAKVTIVNYDDFECPYCSRMHETLFPALLKTYGNQVKIVYKDYPLTEIHPWAMRAAVDANCLAAQSSDAFWDFADYTHANQKTITGSSEKPKIEDVYGRIDDLTLNLGTKHNLNTSELQACVKKQDESAVHASVTEGEKLGVEATPTMFVNDRVVAGIVSEADLRAVIDKALRDAGETPPPPPSADGAARKPASSTK